MLGAQIDFMVKGIDSKAHSVVASRKDAMRRKRQIFYIDEALISKFDQDSLYNVEILKIIQPNATEGHIKSGTAVDIRYVRLLYRFVLYILLRC